MSRIYVTADLHLGHKKLQEVRGVDDDTIVRRWNLVVTKRDVVYVLGDVFKIDRVWELNGIKKLVLGNHDLYPAARYLEAGFSKVQAMAKIRTPAGEALLTHIPVHPGQKNRYCCNIHGHLHSHAIDDQWYACVSLEQTGYAPVSLELVLMGRKGGTR